MTDYEGFCILTFVKLEHVSHGDTYDALSFFEVQLLASTWPIYCVLPRFGASWLLLKESACDEHMYGVGTRTRTLGTDGLETTVITKGKIRCPEWSCVKASMLWSLHNGSGDYY